MQGERFRGRALTHDNDFPHRPFAAATHSIQVVREGVWREVGVAHRHLDRRDPAAESELTAIYLLRGERPDVSLEIGPTVAVGDREKRPDFRIRRGTEPWTYVEVTQLRESQPSARTRQMLGRIGRSIISIERTFIVEVILDREPLEGEDEEIVQRSCELCVSGAEVRVRIEGLATILLRADAANIVEPSPEEDPVPRLALANSVLGPQAENRQIIVRVPFVDTRAEEILTAEARQLSKGESALVMVDVAGQPTAFHGWPELVARRFTPRQHTRVSGLCMFLMARRTVKNLVGVSAGQIEGRSTVRRELCPPHTVRKGPESQSRPRSSAS